MPLIAYEPWMEQVKSWRARVALLRPEDFAREYAALERSLPRVRSLSLSCRSVIVGMTGSQPRSRVRSRRRVKAVHADTYAVIYTERAGPERGWWIRAGFPPNRHDTASCLFYFWDVEFVVTIEVATRGLLVLWAVRELFGSEP